MYSFTRTATLNHAAQGPKAIGFAMELTGYLNKTYGVNIRCGMQMYSTMNICWQMDIDSLDKLNQLFTKTIEDKNYTTMLEKGSEFWVAGSIKDTVLMFPSK